MAARLRRTQSLAALLLLLSLTVPVIVRAEQAFPEEPGEPSLISQYYDTIAGLFFRDYSLRGNGRVDYRTARHILGLAYDDPVIESLDVAPYPLFYWYDADQDGHWIMLVDRKGDGQPAHAEPYDWRQGEDLLTFSKTW